MSEDITFLEFIRWLIIDMWMYILGGLVLTWVAYKLTVAIAPAVDDGFGHKVKRIRTKDVGCMIYILLFIGGLIYIKLAE